MREETRRVKKLTCKHLSLVGLQSTDEVPLDVGGELREGENGSAELPMRLQEQPAHLFGFVCELLWIVLSKVAHTMLVKSKNVACGLELGNSYEAGLDMSDKS